MEEKRSEANQKSEKQSTACDVTLTLEVKKSMFLSGKDETMC